MNHLKVKNALSERGRKRILDSFDPEAQSTANAILDTLEEMAAAEVEFDEEALLKKVNELITAAGNKNAEAVEDKIMKRLDAVRNSLLPATEKLPKKVKNEIFKVVLHNGRNDIKNKVEEVLVKNDITGLSFSEVVDYTIQDKWGDEDPLFSKLHKTKISKFFYTEDDLYTSTVMAKGWSKANASIKDKVNQEITALSRSITTEYVYAKQMVSNEDLDEIDVAGQSDSFFTWLWEELNRTLINSIVRTILIGDSINATADAISNFEVLGTKSATDMFTTVHTAAGDAPTINEVRALCDAIYNPFNKEKVLVLNTQTKTLLEEFIYASGGTTLYRTEAELAGQLGVNSIYTTDILSAAGGVHAICLLPDEYWILEKKAVQIGYPYYERNQQRYLLERNIGGKIHGLKSTAILKVKP